MNKASRGSEWKLALSFATNSHGFVGMTTILANGNNIPFPQASSATCRLAAVLSPGKMQPPMLVEAVAVPPPYRTDEGGAARGR